VDFVHEHLSGSPGAAIKTKHLSFDDKIHFFTPSNNLHQTLLMI
jgi:hypothetical protein